MNRSIFFVLGFSFLLLAQFALAVSYQITNCNELQNINNDLAGNYELVNDIDCTSTRYWDWNARGSRYEGFLPIALSANLNGFTGTFNGNGYKIQNLYIDRAGSSHNDNIGLFGYVTGRISNLKLENFSIKGIFLQGSVGGLVGHLNGEISNCSLINGDINGVYDVGGLVGLMEGGLISNAYSSGTVRGNFRVGGLVGTQDGGTISDSYSTATISPHYYNPVPLSPGDPGEIGGLIGTQRGTGAILTKSYSTGSVGGLANLSSLGGLVGLSQGTISNCYSTSLVQGLTNSEDLGGLVGAQMSGTIIKSYSTGTVSCSTPNPLGGMGGLVGRQGGTISDSFSVSSTSSSSSSGGLVGIGNMYPPTPNISNSYWFNTLLYCCGGNAANQCCGSLTNTTCTTCGKTTASNVFYGNTHAIYSTWDFVNTWTSRTGNYPLLKAPLDCNGPYGGVILNGSSKIFYSKDVVSCGQTCASENRVCNNGVLSGTFTEPACSKFCYSEGHYLGVYAINQDQNKISVCNDANCKNIADVPLGVNARATISTGKKLFFIQGFYSPGQSRTGYLFLCGANDCKKISDNNLFFDGDLERYYDSLNEKEGVFVASSSLTQNNLLLCLQMGICLRAKPGMSETNFRLTGYSQETVSYKNLSKVGDITFISEEYYVRRCNPIITMPLDKNDEHYDPILYSGNYNSFMQNSQLYCFRPRNISSVPFDLPSYSGGVNVVDLNYPYEPRMVSFVQTLNCGAGNPTSSLRLSYYYNPLQFYTTNGYFPLTTSWDSTGVSWALDPIPMGAYSTGGIMYYGTGETATPCVSSKNLIGVCNGILCKVLLQSTTENIMPHEPRVNKFSIKEREISSTYRPDYRTKGYSDFNGENFYFNTYTYKLFGCDSTDCIPLAQNIIGLAPAKKGVWATSSLNDLKYCSRPLMGCKDISIPHDFGVAFVDKFAGIYVSGSLGQISYCTINGCNQISSSITPKNNSSFSYDELGNIFLANTAGDLYYCTPTSCKLIKSGQNFNQLHKAQIPTIELPVENPFFCAGTQPLNSTICPDDTIGPINTSENWSLVGNSSASCTSMKKCEAYCGAGFMQQGSGCVVAPVCGDYFCDSPIENELNCNIDCKSCGGQNNSIISSESVVSTKVDYVFNCLCPNDPLDINLYSDGKFIRSIISECGRGEELVGLAEGLYELRAGLSKPCGICERKEFFAIKGEKVASPVPDSQIVLVALMFLLFVYSLAFNPNKKN